MASSKFGRKLNPYRSLGVKGVRQSVVITNNPSSIDQNQQLLVRFPNLGAHDVIVPGTARLVLTIALDSEDANRTVVQNLGRVFVKKWTIKISGNKVMSIDDSITNSNVLHTNLRTRLSPLKSPVLRKYTNPFKRCGMYPSISNCNAKRCKCCKHLSIHKCYATDGMLGC